MSGGGGARREIDVMAQVTVQQILPQGYVAFAQSHKLPGDVRKAVWALMACRTAGVGGACARVSRRACPAALVALLLPPAVSAMCGVADRTLARPTEKPAAGL